MRYGPFINTVNSNIFKGILDDFGTKKITGLDIRYILIFTSVTMTLTAKYISGLVLDILI